MTPSFQSLGIDQLNLSDRLRLVEEIWDSIADLVEKSPLTAEQRQEVDQRLAEHELDPNAAVPWEQVEAEALKRIGQ